MAEVESNRESIFKIWSHENCAKIRHEKLYDAKGNPRKDNYGRPRIDYIAKLKAMDERALRNETEMMIWLSAYASNNPRSDYHFQCDACYDEWMTRTQSDEEYAQCHKRTF